VSAVEAEYPAALVSGVTRLALVPVVPALQAAATTVARRRVAG
jgi:hypothetical protein